MLETALALVGITLFVGGIYVVDRANNRGYFSPAFEVIAMLCQIVALIFYPVHWIWILIDESPGPPLWVSAVLSVSFIACVVIAFGALWAARSHPGAAGISD